MYVPLTAIHLVVVHFQLLLLQLPFSLLLQLPLLLLDKAII